MRCAGLPGPWQAGRIARSTHPDHHHTKLDKARREHDGLHSTAIPDASGLNRHAVPGSARNARTKAAASSLSAHQFTLRLTKTRRQAAATAAASLPGFRSSHLATGTAACHDGGDRG